MRTGLQALEKIKRFEMFGTSLEHNNLLGEELNTIEKELKALNEILVLYDKWLGNEMSDFEFFTQLNEITHKYDLLEEVLKGE